MIENMMIKKLIRSVVSFANQSKMNKFLKKSINVTSGQGFPA